ncbi:MAG TPA: hypothetical protein VFA03_03695 [Acetobacteraceae bacterium]|nr:hypothetical protein [Acetobacteraceae bacterium]
MPHLTLEDQIHPSDRPRARRYGPGESVRARLHEAAARVMAECGPRIALQPILIEAKVTSPRSIGAYSNIEALLADLLADHLLRLGAAVGAAEQEGAGAKPAALLERLILAWLDAAAAEPARHRVFLTCVHVLPDAVQRSLELRRRVAIEQMQAALSAAVPALRPESLLALYPLFCRMLSDVTIWPEPPAAEERRADARRIAGALLAIAEAEAAGHWPRLGRTEGPDPTLPPVTLDCRQIRRRFRHVLDAVLQGADIAITRRRRLVARIVPAR